MTSADFLDFLQQHRGEAVDLARSATCRRRMCAGGWRCGARMGWGRAAWRARCRRCARSSSFCRSRGRVENIAVRRVRPPKLPPGVPKPVSIDGAQALLDEAEIIGNEPWIAARNVAVLTLLYGAGLRISEALDLNREALPLPEALVITGKGNKQRVVPLLPEAREAVDAYVALCPLQRRARTGRSSSARAASGCIRASCRA